MKPEVTLMATKSEYLFKCSQSTFQSSPGLYPPVFFMETAGESDLLHSVNVHIWYVYSSSYCSLKR